MTKSNFTDHMLDITAPNVAADIEVSLDGKELWVNVDGECVLRVCQIPKLEIGNVLVEKSWGIFQGRRYVKDVPGKSS